MGLANQSLRRSVGPDDLEDVRIALVMNGGLSLAVWIGGVTRELSELTESRPQAGGTSYQDLLDITRSTARVDVITGTSAGGLNGAFLALATVYGTSLETLADLWIDKGAFGRLLRPPMQSDPASLLRGDEYFLPELRAALATLWPSPEQPPRPPDATPIHLVMTTTLLRGDQRVFTDDYGTSITEVEHRGTFRFKRDRRTDPGAPTGPRSDPFATRSVIDKLALAARSTASFPFAFEPSWIPVGEARDPLHPDMAGSVDFASSGWVLDGGVLVNKPVELALRAVFDQPAGRQVRRALVYVDPDPDPIMHEPQRSSLTPDTSPPQLRQVMLDSLVTLPRVQSLAQTFEDLRRHNARVRDQRALRVDLASLFDVPGERGLDDLAADLWPGYRRERARRAARRVLELGREAGAFRRAGEQTPGWSPDEVVAAFMVAFEDGRLPFVPDAAALAEGTTGGWGLASLERLAFLCLDLLQRALWLAPIGPSEPAEPSYETLRAQVRALRERLHAEIFGLPAMRLEDDRFWGAALDLLPAPPATSHLRQEILGEWLAEQLRWWPLPPDARPPDPTDRDATVRQARQATEEVTHRLAVLLAEAEPILRDICGPAAAGFRGAGKQAHELARLVDLVYSAATTSIDQDATASIDHGGTPLRRLHRLEVVYVMLSRDSVLEQSVELMRIDGATPNSFNGPDELERKLTGTRTGHFAAFYKASWRANDWLWGRLDGATRLTQLLLGPDRLRQLGYSIDTALEAVEAAALGPSQPTSGVTAASDRAHLASRFDEAGCRRELTYLEDDDLPVPPSLPTCAMQIARRRHLSILRSDLGRIAAGVDVDEQDGARRNGAGQRLRSEYRRAVEQAGAADAIPAATLFALIRSCEVGAETIADDAGSDLYAGTASHATAVGMAALDGKQAGLGPARLVTRPLRGVLLILFALVAGSTRLGRAARAAVALALASGGALVAVALLRDETPTILVALGAALVVSGVAMAALRSRAWQFAVVLGVPVIAVAAFVLLTPVRQQLTDHRGSLWTIGLLTVAAFLLGSVRQPDMPPRPLGSFTRAQLRVTLGVSAAAALALMLWLGRDLDPAGILGLEFAGTVDAAQAALVDLGPLERVRASLWWDFGLMVAYAVALAAWAVIALRHVQRLPVTRWRLLGRTLRPKPDGFVQALTVAAWAAPAAAVLDAVANLALLRAVEAFARSGAATPMQLDPVFPAVAWIAACMKFVLIGAVLVGPAAARLVRADPD